MKNNNEVRSKNSSFSGTGWKVAGALPVAAFLILMIFLNAQGSFAVFEAPILLAFLNTIFLCVIPLVVAFAAAKSHRATGVFAFLMIGCGLVFFGVSSFYAGWVMPLAGGPNPTVTLHNLGSLFASIFQIASVHFFMQELVGVSEMKNRVYRYEILYAGIIVLVSITAVLAFRENLPIFLIHLPDQVYYGNLFWVEPSACLPWPGWHLWRSPPRSKQNLLIGMDWHYG